MKNLLALALILMFISDNNQAYSQNSINYGKFPIEKVAQTPPLGWNSWDVFGADVTEQEVKAIADYMADNLKQFGYEYVVIDIAWYAPNASAIDKKYQEPYPEQRIDEYGRLIPALNRFPSAKGNNGYKELADYVHDKGLKFGIHVMRGIPRQAVEQNTPIKGTPYHARDIVMYEKTCTFYDGLLSIDMEKPGAQEYYNSIVELYAEWGVDFIKADDMTSYPPKLDEAKGLRYAIEQVERPVVLSLSPGAVNSWDRSFLHHYADLYRISGDFWDEWSDLKDMFNRARIFKGHTGPGGWADCDMIPLGKINIRGEHGDGARMSRFTPDEYKTLMSFWTIYRSPLMLGMDLTQMDDFTYSVITNEDALKINQNSTNNREIDFVRDSYTIWAANSPDGNEHYLAMFNLEDEPKKLQTTLDAIGIDGPIRVKDIWTGETTEVKDERISYEIEPHGVKYIIIN
jgi:hypothetical protein